MNGNYPRMELIMVNNKVKKLQRLGRIPFWVRPIATILDLSVKVGSIHNVVSIRQRVTFFEF